MDPDPRAVAESSSIRPSADDWRPESHTERLQRQAREWDLTARLAWLEEVTTFAIELQAVDRRGD